MTPEELRSLADEATAGPWKITRRGMEEYHGSTEVGGDTYVCLSAEDRDARLLALAPDLARLCAELGEALDALWNEAVGDSGGADEQVKAALAKLSELNTGAEHPPGAERTQ